METDILQVVILVCFNYSLPLSVSFEIQLTLFAQSLLKEIGIGKSAGGKRCYKKIFFLLILLAKQKEWSTYNRQ